MNSYFAGRDVMLHRSRVDKIATARMSLPTYITLFLWLTLIIANNNTYLGFTVVDGVQSPVRVEHGHEAWFRKESGPGLS